MLSVLPTWPGTFALLMRNEPLSTADSTSVLREPHVRRDWRMLADASIVVPLASLNVKSSRIPARAVNSHRRQARRDDRGNADLIRTHRRLIAAAIARAPIPKSAGAEAGSGTDASIASNDPTPLAASNAFLNIAKSNTLFMPSRSRSPRG